MSKKNQIIGQQQSKIDDLERELILLRKVTARRSDLSLLEDTFGKRKLVARVMSFLTITDTFNLACTSRVVRHQITLCDKRLQLLVELKENQMQKLKDQVDRAVGKIRMTRSLHEFH
jgi:hypothetical protein